MVGSIHRITKLIPLINIWLWPNWSICLPISYSELPRNAYILINRSSYLTRPLLNKLNDILTLHPPLTWRHPTVQFASAMMLSRIFVGRKKKVKISVYWKIMTALRWCVPLVRVTHQSEKGLGCIITSSLLTCLLVVHIPLRKTIGQKVWGTVGVLETIKFCSQPRRAISWCKLS